MWICLKQDSCGHWRRVHVTEPWSNLRHTKNKLSTLGPKQFYPAVVRIKYIWSLMLWGVWGMLPRENIWMLESVKCHFQYFEGYFKGILVILNGYLTHNNCTNHKRIQSIKIIEKYWISITWNENIIYMLVLVRIFLRAPQYFTRGRGGGGGGGAHTLNFLLQYLQLTKVVQFLNYYWKKTKFVKKPWGNVWFFWVMRLFKKS
jgi:hypothetical protein